MITVLVGSLFAWGLVTYLSKTTVVADFGGEYIEGLIGQPNYINPVLSRSNDVDQDISNIVYNSLVKYDGEGHLINDLAESYELSEDKNTVTFHLKEGLKWHDGQPLTANDALYTFNVISNPAFKSPLRSTLQGVTANAIDDRTIEFKTETPYFGFLHVLTFGILPRHIWEELDPEKFSLNELNLEPIGSGPYKFDTIQKDSQGNILSYKMIANPEYFEGNPFISKLTFNFYADESGMIDAYNKKEISSMAGISPKRMSDIKLSKASDVYEFDIPRYFAVFLNQSKNAPLAFDEVREALSRATNREEIIDQVLAKQGEQAYAPLLPKMDGYTDDIKKREYDPGKAEEILKEKGWKKNDEGILEKDGTRLEFNLITTDWADSIQTAELLKKQWEAIGARVNLTASSISDIQQNYIRPREYDSLLFGQVLSADQDLFSFWHSSRKKDPGLNLSLYGDEETDKLLDNARTEFDEGKRNEIYHEFIKKINEDNPAIFLYSPAFVMITAKKLDGLNIENLVLPSKRFYNINNWYLKTKREWK